MIVSKVIGKIWTAHSMATLKGHRFIVVKPVDISSKEETTGNCFVAVDTLGVGMGDIVLVTQGSVASRSVGENVPIDAAVIGLVDKYETDKNT